jgi:peptide deformylase
MALDIAQLGQPVLWQKAADVPVHEIRTPQFQQFLADMRTTLDEAKGIGLAAPQVFQSRRVFLAGVLPPLEPEGPPQFETFINPRLTPLADEQTSEWEGCLSYVELSVLVPRWRKVRIDYLNAHGEPKALELEGFPARVVQHEFDHLEGILTIDRAASRRHIIKTSELKQLMEADEEEEDHDA